MIPKSVFENIYRMGYEHAEKNREVRFLGSDKMPGVDDQAIDRAFGQFQNKYPLNEWDTRVYTFTGHPDEVGVIGATAPRGSVDQAMQQWKPAGVLGNSCGKLKDVLKEPRRVPAAALDDVRGRLLCEGPADSKHDPEAMMLGPDSEEFICGHCGTKVADLTGDVGWRDVKPSYDQPNVGKEFRVEVEASHASAVDIRNQLLQVNGVESATVYNETHTDDEESSGDCRTVTVDGDGLPEPFDSGELTFRIETDQPRLGRANVKVDLVSFEAEGDLTEDFTLELEGTFDG